MYKVLPHEPIVEQEISFEYKGKKRLYTAFSLPEPDQASWPNRRELRRNMSVRQRLARPLLGERTPVSTGCVAEEAKLRTHMRKYAALRHELGTYPFQSFIDCFPPHFESKDAVDDAEVERVRAAVNGMRKAKTLYSANMRSVLPQLMSRHLQRQSMILAWVYDVFHSETNAQALNIQSFASFSKELEAADIDMFTVACLILSLVQLNPETAFHRTRCFSDRFVTRQQCMEMGRAIVFAFQCSLATLDYDVNTAVDYDRQNVDENCQKALQFLVVGGHFALEMDLLTDEFSEILISKGMQLIEALEDGIIPEVLLSVSLVLISVLLKKAEVSYRDKSFFELEWLDAAFLSKLSLENREHFFALAGLVSGSALRLKKTDLGLVFSQIAFQDILRRQDALHQMAGLSSKFMKRALAVVHDLLSHSAQSDSLLLRTDGDDLFNAVPQSILGRLLSFAVKSIETIDVGDDILRRFISEDGCLLSHPLQVDEKINGNSLRYYSLLYRLKRLEHRLIMYRLSPETTDADVESATSTPTEGSSTEEANSAENLCSEAASVASQLSEAGMRISEHDPAIEQEILDELEDCKNSIFDLIKEMALGHLAGSKIVNIRSWWMLLFQSHTQIMDIAERISGEYGFFQAQREYYLHLRVWKEEYWDDLVENPDGYEDTISKLRAVNSGLERDLKASYPKVVGGLLQMYAQYGTKSENAFAYVQEMLQLINEYEDCFHKQMQLAIPKDLLPVLAVIYSFRDVFATGSSLRAAPSNEAGSSNVVDSDSDDSSSAAGPSTVLEDSEDSSDDDERGEYKINEKKGLNKPAVNESRKNAKKKKKGKRKKR